MVRNVILPSPDSMTSSWWNTFSYHEKYVWCCFGKLYDLAKSTPWNVITEILPGHLTNLNKTKKNPVSWDFEFYVQVINHSASQVNCSVNYVCVNLFLVADIFTIIMDISLFITLHSYIPPIFSYSKVFVPQDFVVPNDEFLCLG